MSKALTSNPTEEIEQILNKFNNVKLDEFHWAELDTWANNLEDIEAKERVLRLIEQFKNWQLDSHKLGMTS